MIKIKLAETVKLVLKFMVLYFKVKRLPTDPPALPFCWLLFLRGGGGNEYSGGEVSVGDWG